MNIVNILYDVVSGCVTAMSPMTLSAVQVLKMHTLGPDWTPAWMVVGFFLVTVNPGDIPPGIRCPWSHSPIGLMFQSTFCRLPRYSLTCNLPSPTHQPPSYLSQPCLTIRANPSMFWVWFERGLRIQQGACSFLMYIQSC